MNDRTKSSGKRPIEQYVCGMLMIIIMNHYISNEKLAAVCCSDDKLNDKLNESQPTGHTVEKRDYSAIPEPCDQSGHELIVFHLHCFLINQI